MTTTKSIIAKAVDVALASVYTNSSGGPAVLKAVNAVGVANPATIVPTTGDGSEWTMFGHNCPVYHQANPTGFGVPMPIRLNTDRVLLLYLPHHMHVGGGNDFMGSNTIHTQITEFQANKYVAGPIANIQLPASPNLTSFGLWQAPGGMSVGTGQTYIKALVLSPTKVVLAIRAGTYFRLVRLTIVGNNVDVTTITDLDLTTATFFNTTTAGAFDLVAVPGNANKVVVGGYGTVNWLLQSINVPDTGAMTAGSTPFSTGLATSTYHFAMTNLNRTQVGGVVTYVVAASTSSAVAAVQNFALNEASNLFSSVGTAVTLNHTSTVALLAGCVSVDGTAKGVIATMDSANYGQLVLVAQNSLTQATNAVTNVALQHSVARGLKQRFDWGQQKVVFAGTNNTLVMYDSTGVGTNLIPATFSATSSAAPITQWFPFDSRPLFTCLETTIVGRQSQYFSRTGATATTAGAIEFTANYFPHGHNYGGHYGWSEVAQCWMVGQGGRIYALNSAGQVLNEIPLYLLSTSFNYNFSIKQLSVTPSGKVLFMTDCVGVHPVYSPDSLWNAYTAAVYFGVLAPVPTPADLQRASFLTPLYASPYHVAVDMVWYVDYFGVERAYALAIYNATNAYTYVAKFDGAAWSTFAQTAAGTVAVGQSWHQGARPHLKLIQDSPCDVNNQTGLWRLFGSQGNASQAQFATLAVGVTPCAEVNFTSLQLDLVLSTAGQEYGVSRHYNQNVSVAASYNVQFSWLTAFFSVGGRISHLINPGYTVPMANTTKYINLSATKYLFVIAPCNTSAAQQTPNAYVFDSFFPHIAPKYILPGTLGNGWTTTYAMNQNKLQIFAAGVNQSYTLAGPLDTPSLTIYLNDGVNDFPLTPAGGQNIKAGSSYRANDTYMVPNGYSIKMKSSIPLTIDALLTIVEDA